MLTIDRATLGPGHDPAACDDCGTPIKIGAEVFETSKGAVYCSWECVTAEDRRRNPDDYTPPPEPLDPPARRFSPEECEAIADGQRSLSILPIRPIPPAPASGGQPGLLGPQFDGPLTGGQMAFAFPEPSRYDQQDQRRPRIKDDANQMVMA